jgi:hypothetical protein
MERLASIEVNSFDEATESQAGVILILPEADAIAEYNDTYAITPFTLKAIFDNQFDFGVMRQYTESTFVDSINADGTYEISRTSGAMHIINVSPSVTSIDFTFDLSHGEGTSVQLVNAETATVTWPESTVWTNGVPVLDDRVIIEVLNIDSTVYASATNVGIEEELSGSWDILTASYTGNSFSVGSQETIPMELFFSPDGLNMFILGLNSNNVHHYTLSSAFDITTTTYTGNSFFVGFQGSSTRGLFFSPDGLNMFVVGSTNDSVHQYTLSSAFDITTVNYTGNNFFVGSQDINPQGLFFSPDGLNMFVVGSTNDSVNHYTLSSAFDITTVTYTGNNFFVGSQETRPQDVFFSPDGFNMFVTGGVNDSVHHYTLSSAFDITTTTYTGNSFFVGSQDDDTQGLFFSPDGFNMFSTGSNTASVYQYTLT